MTETAPVLVVGEALIDIVHPPTGEPTEHVGGSPANVAKGIARLGHPVTLATHIGCDDRGARISDELTADGVQLTRGSVSAPRTSTATALLDDDGAATYAFEIDWRLEPHLRAVEGGHLHTGSIAVTLDPGATSVRRLAEASRAGATISYDPNARPAIMGEVAQARAQVEALASFADVVKVSDEDLAWLYGPAMDPVRIARQWNRGGPALVVVTRGGEGAIAIMRGEVTEFEAARVPVVDTVGAGDSFMAGLISGLLDQGLLGGTEARHRLTQASPAQVSSAVVRAIECAGITVSRAGANPPTRAELGA
ncbi:MAG: carbohydrate kinase [bacterium]|nr:carbohydrate kinase [bacterium]